MEILEITSTYRCEQLIALLYVHIYYVWKIAIYVETVPYILYYRQFACIVHKNIMHVQSEIRLLYHNNMISAIRIIYRSHFSTIKSFYGHNIKLPIKTDTYDIITKKYFLLLVFT